MSPITEFWILYWTELLILGTILGLVALVLCRIWHQKKIAHQDEKISRVHELSGDLERNTDQMREGLHNLGGRKFKTARSILLATALLIYIGGETINRGATANWWRIQHLEDDASFWQYISFVQDPWFFLGNGVITIGLLGIVYILIGTYWGNVAAVVALFLVVTVPTAVMWWIG
jgi:hypothetical protein